MKSVNQGAESNLSWLLAPKPVRPALLLSLPRPNPTPLGEGQLCASCGMTTGHSWEWEDNGLSLPGVWS